MEGPGAAGLESVVPGFVIGLAFGAVAERMHLCTMGAVADVVIFASWRRARIWAAATATAALALGAMSLAGTFDAATMAFWRDAATWWAFAGGLLYGVGMVVAGGCLSRAWLRAAAGSGDALVVIALASAVALAASAGASGMAPAGAIGAERWGPPPILAAASVAVAVTAWVWVLADPRFRSSLRALMPPVALGALVAAAIATHPGVGATGLNFVPLADADGHVLALLAGAVVGAFASAIIARRFRWQAPPWREPGRQLTGAIAMGGGAALVGGGTVAVGIGGVAVAAPAAWLALVGMLAGAALAVQVMLSGGPLALWRELRQAFARRG